MTEDTQAPVLVTGKTEEGEEVQIDVGLMLATDTAIRETFAAGLQKFLNTGFPADYSMGFAVIVSERFRGEGVSHIIEFPKEDFSTYLAEYIPGFIPE